MKFMKYKEKDIEIWMTIRNFPNYKISNWGRVWNVNFGKFIFGKKSPTGYWQVTLYNDRGDKKMFMIHRLVAEYFIPNLGGYTQIDHINEDKSNNRWDNLRWVTPKENINYGSHNQRASESRKRNRNYIICQYDLNGNLIQEYNTISEAARAVGGRTDSIRWALDGKLKTTYGFVWRRRLKEQQS